MSANLSPLVPFIDGKHRYFYLSFKSLKKLDCQVIHQVSMEKKACALIDVFIIWNC